MVRLLSTIIFTLLFCFTNAYAAAGCCSHHGGVNGCNKDTNHQLCKDGTSSPTCLCTGGTEAKPKKTTKPAAASNATTESSATAAPAESTAATTTATTAEKKKTKGCCAKHGGVASCNATTGYYACKDGTASATCKCS